jgi:hypothetical protein
MAIHFSNSKSISETGGRIVVPGRIVQTVHTLNTGGMATSSTGAVDFFTSGSITLTNASNKILIELHSDNRSTDWGDGQWNLHYMDIIHVQSGTQLSYTGYNGEYTYTIRHIHRVAIHTPGSVGPHSYKCRGWSYQAKNTTFGTGADGTPAYLRLTEIAV